MDLDGAVHENDIESVKKIVDFFASNQTLQQEYYTKQKNQKFKTPLSYLLDLLPACNRDAYRSKFEMAEYMIEKKVWINCANAENMHPLDELLSQNRAALADFYMENNPCVPKIFQFLRWEEGTLYNLIYHNTLQDIQNIWNPSIEHICQRYGKYFFKDKEDTPLLYALRLKKYDIALWLLNKCPELYNIKNKNGESAGSFHLQQFLISQLKD